MNAMYCNALVAGRAGPHRVQRLPDHQWRPERRRSGRLPVRSIRYAAYSQATFHLNDYCRFTAGGRWTRDEKSGSYAQRVTNPFIVPFRAPEVSDLPGPLRGALHLPAQPELAAERDVMVFANHSTGYKSGGYNSGGGSPALSTFDPPAI